MDLCDCCGVLLMDELMDGAVGGVRLHAGRSRGVRMVSLLACPWRVLGVADTNPRKTVQI
jgi:hypothetical protein